MAAPIASQTDTAKPAPKQATKNRKETKKREAKEEGPKNKQDEKKETKKQEMKEK
jgi:hypothetical protein